MHFLPLHSRASSKQGRPFYTSQLSLLTVVCTLGFTTLGSIASEAKAAAATPAQSATKEGNLAVNGDFEDGGGWKLTLRDGAEADVAPATEQRHGKGALRFTKSNSKGAALLRSEKPIRVQPGVTYTFRGWFRSEGSPMTSLLLFRVGPSTSPLRYDAIDRSAGWSSQSLVINTPPGRWEKRVITYKSDRERDVYLSIMGVGNAFSVTLDDIEFTTQGEKAEAAKPASYRFPYSEAQVLEAMEARSPSTAHVEKKGDRALLLVDGKVTPPILYKGLESSDTRGDYEAFSKAGVPLAITAVRLGPSSFYEETLWKGKGEYDFAPLDRALLAALRKDPAANIVLDIWIYPYPTWGDEYPQECNRNLKGETILTKAFNYNGVAPAGETKLFNAKKKLYGYPSFHSLQWRSDASACLVAVAQHLKT